MQLWHGTTDTTLAYPNFGEEIKQWTNLHGLSQTPAFTDHPQSSWTRTRYGDTGTQATVEGISIAGIGHQLPMAGSSPTRSPSSAWTAPRDDHPDRHPTPTDATPTPTPTVTTSPASDPHDLANHAGIVR